MGQISKLYKYMAAFVNPLQQKFDDFNAFRTKQYLIANCKCQIGQLTNVLNILYDSTQKRIFISQSVVAAISDPMFQYPAIHSDSDFASAPEIQERGFNDRSSETLVTINIPSAIYNTIIVDLTATVNQIMLLGIPYNINSF